MGDPIFLAARVLYTAPHYWRPQFLSFSPAVVGDLADQVATKRVSGSRLGPFISGLLRCNIQQDRRPSEGCGDWEAGGRASAAAGRVRARRSLDAIFLVPKGSSRKIQAPTVFLLPLANCRDDALRRRELVLVEGTLRLGLLRARKLLRPELLQARNHFLV